MVEKISKNYQHPKQVEKFYQKVEESSFVESNQDTIKNSILSQVHYYFSDENLYRDIYLRCNMNEDGWVPISFICAFNRMKSFDQSTVVNTIQLSSNNLELNSKLDSIRIKSDEFRNMWILSEEIKNGFLSARGTQQQTQTNQKQDSEGWETVVPKHHKPTKDTTISSITTNSINNSTTEQEIFEFSDSEEQDFFSKERRNFENRGYQEEEEEDYLSTDEEFNYSGEEEDLTIDDQEELMKKLIIVTQSPYKKNKINSRKYMSNEIASIINDGLYFYEQDSKRKKQIFKPTNFNTLIVGDKKKDQEEKPTTTSLTQPTQSTSNIPAWNVNTVKSGDKPTMAQLLKEAHLGIPIQQESNKAPTRFYSPKPKQQRNQNSNNNNNNTSNKNIGWVVSSDSTNSSPGTTPSNINDMKVGSAEEGLPYFQHPSYELLEENGFVQHKYEKYKNKCLKERKRLGIGKSSEMNTLFRFWSHFLRTHFIVKIYQEFVDISLEDAKLGANYGMECMFRFYSYGLEKKFKLDLFNDFQKYTLQDFKSGSLYALEKFWAFLKYRKDQTQIEILPELKEILSKFKSIYDFRKSTSTSNSTTKSTTKSTKSNNSYHHHNNNNNYSTKKSSQSSYPINNNNNNNNNYSSMKPQKPNSISNSSKMMNSNKNGFM